MKKITLALAIFLSGLNLFVKAQCPVSMAFLGGDTNYVYNGVGGTFNSGVTMACNAMPFYVWANQPSTLNNPNNDIYTPCIKTEYDRYWTTTRNSGTQSGYEGGFYLGCIGPSGGCSFPVGGNPLNATNGLSVWDLYWSYMDETQSHDMVFSKPAAVAWNTHTVTVQDCWSDVTLPSVVATPINWTSGMTSWTVTIPANTPIGNGTFTLNPSVPGAITDLNFGYVYVRPNLLPAGTYTLNYNFSGSECPSPGTNGQFIFTITNPYSAAWTAPSNLCTNSSCVSLPSTVTGTSGGTWSGTGVSGTQFCPGTSGAGTFGVTYSVGISTTCRATQTNSITVTATPTLSVAGGNLCSGQSIVLSNTGSSASGYTWSPSGGSASSATVSPTSSTTYTLTGTNGNCSSSTTAAVNVTATPTLNVAGANICSNQSVVLTNTGTSATSYTWSPSGGSASSATVSPGTTTTYTLSGANGTCTGTTTATVNVTATPTVSISGAGTICNGGSIVLSGGTASSYTWSPSGGSAGSATVSPGATTTYTLTGANGTCTASATAVVNVTPNPTVSISSSNGTTICSTGSTTLTAGGATNYTWSPNAGGGGSGSVVVNPSTTTTYTLTGETGGCTASQQITVNVTPTPTINATANSGTVCAGQTTTVTASGATNYTWMPGGSSTNPLPVTPGSTTTYTVTGESSGCTATQVITVNVNQLPTVNIAAQPASLCAGQTTTLTASGASTYTWSANAGGGNANPVTVSPASTDTYTVTATDNNGCVNQGTITVNLSTSAPVTITASSNTLCAGQTITLNGGGATSYTWSPGGQTSPTITVTPSSSTTYTLDGSNGTCAGTQTLSVNVIPNPTVTATASSTTLCSGGSATLTGGGATNYTWMPGGSTASSFTDAPTGTTTYTVTGETNGCSATAAITLSVTPTPTVTASVSGATVCAGQSTVLTGGGAGTYTWLPGGMTSPSVTVTPGSTTTYTLAGANGTCTATATATVSVTPLPTVTAVAVSGTLCSGQNTTLNAGGATTYTWSSNAGSATSSSVSVNPATTTVYTVTGSANGCDNSAQVTVTVNPTPTLAISAASATICAGQSTTLTGSGATNYTWMPGGSTSSSVNESPAANTTYTVTGETAGCTASATVEVIVNPTPVLGSNPVIDSALCGMPTGAVTGINVTGGTPGYTYQWYSGSSPIPGATGDSLVNVAAGTYSVLVTDANNCVASGGVAVFTVPGSAPVTAAITPVISQGQAPLNVSFTNGSVGATVYSWNFGNGNSSTAQTPPTMVYNGAGTYTVTMLAANGGCWDTAMAIVIVDMPTTILIPNIFSPNGDGTNDEFYVVNTGLTTLSCDIFNRWGQKMFTLNSPQQRWDGKAPNGEQASEGSYFYILRALGVDGQTYEREGYITLVR